MRPNKYIKILINAVLNVYYKQCIFECIKTCITKSMALHLCNKKQFSKTHGPRGMNYCNKINLSNLSKHFNNNMVVIQITCIHITFFL